MIFRFASYELDEEAGELRRDGATVEVQPKPLALLFLLVRERERVVPSDEIFDALWPGVAVTPGSLTRAVSLARKAIGDTHRGAQIRSVSKRGYRFTADVVQVEGPPGAAQARSAPEGGPPFVGRDEALAMLRRGFTEATGRRGGLVLVSGPPGIGKTRLCEVFLAEVQRAGGQGLVGRCHEGEGVPAFWPWAQVLRRIAGAPGGASLLHELAGSAAELADLVPGLAPSGGASRRPDLAPAQSRFLLFDAVTRALLRASAVRPTVLVLEDVQWAGHDSLRLLEHLAFELSEHSLLVLATLREEAREADHAVERVLPKLRQHPACFELSLRELSRGDVALLLERTIGRPPPTDLTSELFARTEGVPLFLREALRLLSERGDLRRPEGVRRWGITLPSLTLDLIRRPLARLSPETSAFVGAAAVLGREFVASHAAEVAESPRESVLDRVEEAVRSGVVEPVDDAPLSFRFTHALFREAA